MSSDPFEGFDLDTAVAGVRSNMTDVRILLKVLAGQLADAVGPERLAIEHARRLRRTDDVQALAVTMGDDEFRAEIDGATLHCMIGHRSGGIRIRNEQVSADDWLKRLLQSLQAEAAYSQKARLALEHIVIGGAS
ncbi:MAG TPA: hypothetical protein VK386_09750 [Acidimicrobiales bacterium]|nr:hypothetical protein [Acidimicrobiales bacterium]